MARFRRPPAPGARLADAATRPGRAGDTADVPSGAPGGGSGGTYTIRKGDTLEGIARDHGVTVGDLRQANPGVRDRRLMPGQALTLP
jgi:LysM repeat protein